MLALPDIIASMPLPTRIALETLGCKLNHAETESLARELTAAGGWIVSWETEADIYILNTCTVTHVADRKSRQLLRQAHRMNPAASIVVTGCYAGRQEKELSRIAGVSLLVSNEDKPGLVARLTESGYLPVAVPNIYTNVRTRAFIKAQDGCNRFCAYCIVPYVRGREKSRQTNEVVAEIQARVEEGYKEVVLTGTEIGAYAADGFCLKDLLEKILDTTDISRLRLSSLQPQEVTPELVDLWRNPRLCPHFHLSLQSGNRGVLERMNRCYTPREYEAAVGRIRDIVHGAALTTDIIAGFPGETETEFAESLAFCRQMAFARIHVFPFSPRPGTKAASMSGQISEPIKSERSRQMRALAGESSRAFHNLFLNTESEVLWEQAAAGIWSGYTPNYIRVYAGSVSNLINQLKRVRLTGLYRDGVWGEIIEGNK
jgi:threonylcarbamoyladenosine tRNA methylthiotransferase MtaB